MVTSTLQPFWVSRWYSTVMWNSRTDTLCRMCCNGRRRQAKRQDFNQSALLLWWPTERSQFQGLTLEETLLRNISLKITNSAPNVTLHKFKQENLQQIIYDFDYIIVFVSFSFIVCNCYHTYLHFKVMVSSNVSSHHGQIIFTVYKKKK